MGEGGWRRALASLGLCSGWRLVVVLVRQGGHLKPEGELSRPGESSGYRGSL